MAMNTKNDADERERPRRLKNAPGAERREAVLAFLKERVWPHVPKGEIGRALINDEEDDILGYGRRLR